MKGSARRAQVLAVAGELFADNGYHRTTVEHIVNAAGIARGTFYVYFKDKRSIFEELVDSYIGEIDQRIVRIDPALGVARCLELLRQNIHTVFAVSFEKQRPLAKILISDAVGLDDDFDQKLLGFYALATDLIESALILGQELGIVRACNERIAAFYILGSIKEALYQVLMHDLAVDIDSLVDELLAFLAGGVVSLPQG